jgi:exodeoxyribonuclease-5
MTPTADQSTALQSMATWINEGYSLNSRRFMHDYPFYSLEGYAGTGKSYSIFELLKILGLKPSEVAFTAPTNKAVKVLRNYLDEVGLEACLTRTIYSLLGLSLQANGEVKELAKPEEPVDLSRFKVIIVDEASMVNRFLMTAIEEAAAAWGRPFIFMGDPAQLPPVGESHSPVFKIQNKFQLTEVLRYGNSMLDLATRIRNVVDHPFPSVAIKTVAPVYRLGKPAWVSTIMDNLPLIESGDAKIIAWRNITVDDYNRMVRKKLFDNPKDPWVIGDKIVAKAPLLNLDRETIMQNAEEAKILDVCTGTHPTYGEYEVFHIHAEHETGRMLNLMVTTPASQFKVNQKLAVLSNQAKQGDRWLWKEFWNLKEAFHDIKHSYAITSHGSQGSSFRKVFVDLEDIMKNQNRSEAFRSLYVAATRQREEIYFA